MVEFPRLMWFWAASRTSEHKWEWNLYWNDIPHVWTDQWFHSSALHTSAWGIVPFDVLFLALNHTEGFYFLLCCPPPQTGPSIQVTAWLLSRPHLCPLSPVFVRTFVCAGAFLQLRMEMVGNRAMSARIAARGCLLLPVKNIAGPAVQNFAAMQSEKYYYTIMIT